MKHIDTIGIGLLIWQIVLILGFIILTYLAIKLYMRYMRYLQIKTNYLEHKMTKDLK